MPAGEAGRAVFYGFDGFKKAGLKTLGPVKGSCVAVKTGFFLLAIEAAI